MLVREGINLIFFFGLIFNAVLFIPQAVKLYRLKDSKEVSAITFTGFWFVNLFTFLHAYITKDYLLFWGTSLSVFLSGLVVILIIYYRVKRANNV